MDTITRSLEEIESALHHTPLSSPSALLEEHAGMQRLPNNPQESRHERGAGLLPSQLLED